MIFRPLEASLARLAINESAHRGERSAAAGKFFLFLKERGVTAEEFLNGGNDDELVALNCKLEEENRKLKVWIWNNGGPLK